MENVSKPVSPLNSNSQPKKTANNVTNVKNVPEKLSVMKKIKHAMNPKIVNMESSILKNVSPNVPRVFSN